MIIPTARTMCGAPETYNLYAFDISFIGFRFLSQTSAWLGMDDIRYEGLYISLDTNRPTKYFNWHSGEPSGGSGEHCVEIYFDSGEWNDVSCNHMKSFVCKKGQRGEYAVNFSAA